MKQPSSRRLSALAAALIFILAGAPPVSARPLRKQDRFRAYCVAVYELTAAQKMFQWTPRVYLQPANPSDPEAREMAQRLVNGCKPYNSQLRLYPASRLRRDGEFKDRRTGKAGILVIFSPLVADGDGGNTVQVKLTFGQWEPGLYRLVYHLKKTNGRWQVSRARYLTRPPAP